MPKFTEHALEMSIMQLFENQGYTYVSGNDISRPLGEVILEEDLKEYLRKKYKKDEITESEIDSIILFMRAVSGTLYETNRVVYSLMQDGFVFNREDATKKDIYIELIDYKEPDNNIFKIVNQFEIEGYNYQTRIPDGIVL